MSKRQTAIAIMKSNPNKLAIDVIEEIAKANGDSLAKAKGLYKWIVAHDMAPGETLTAGKRGRVKGTTPKTAKEIFAKKPKITKVPAPKVQGDKPKITDKTVEEIADIRAKNLARLKAVGRKYAKGQYAEGATGRMHTDEEARAEVANLENELDSFKAPAFLNLDDVKALV